MMIKMTDDQMARKLKRERVEVCLNCQRFSDCRSIGEFEECKDFEARDEAWVIRKV
jgi:hypothetical protein